MKLHCCNQKYADYNLRIIQYNTDENLTLKYYTDIEQKDSPQSVLYEDDKFRMNILFHY